MSDVATRPSPTFLLSALDYLVAGGILLFLFVLFAASLGRFPYYGPVSVVEEAAYTYTSANNFLKYGFLASGLLQDFSTSSNPADHPYIYNHMPPGPDILTAFLLEATGGSYRVTRLFYALVFLAGIAVYLRFVALILARLGLRGAGYAVLFLGPFMLFQNMERQPYSPFPLLAFSPLLALAAHYRTDRGAYLWLAGGVTFLSSLYLEYNLLAGLVWCWVFLYLTQVVRLDGRHLLGFLAIVACGIGLHLLQNLLYLGPNLFYRELMMTLGNRMVGSPSQEAMKEFYQSIGLVHHGSHAPDARVLLFQHWMQFWFPGRKFIIPTALVALGWALWRRARGGEPNRLGHFGRLWLWIAGTLTLPLLMFPAFGQEVNLFGSRANLYFLAVGVTAVLAFAMRQLIAHRPQFGQPWAAYASWRWFVPATVWVGLLLGVFLSVQKVVAANARELRQLIAVSREFKYVRLGDIRHFSGHLFMTNINTPAVGFFVQEAGYGVCGPDSLSEGGDVDPDKCRVSFMRRHEQHAGLRPRYFFFFSSPDLFPGFADCLPSGALLAQRRGGDDCATLMYRRLSERFRKVFDNGLFEVFDLHTSPTHLGG